MVTCMNINDVYPILAIAIGPFIIFLLLIIYVWYKDYYEREPKSLVILMFIWGTIAAVMAKIIESSLNVSQADVIMMLIFVPIIEEFLKTIGLLYLGKSPEFEGIMDGVVYGVAVGAGFALTMDVLYGASILGQGIATVATYLILRAIVEPVSHPFFSAWMGAEIGKANLKKPSEGGSREIPIRGRNVIIFTGFITTILLHSIWNYISVTSVNNLFNASIYALMLIILYMLLFETKIRDGLALDALIYERPVKKKQQDQQL